MSTLSDSDYQAAASVIGCDVAAIKAVQTVETAGSGMFPDSTPRTLFEGHWFYRLTNGRFAESNPTLCYQHWTKEFYGKTWQEEKSRLSVAITLDRTAALQSASWGLFQIMGFNHAVCGFTDVQAFVNAMYSGEGAQLKTFADFVVHNGWADELRNHDWAGFARLYNGPAYQQNSYDTKLATAYAKFKA